MMKQKFAFDFKEIRQESVWFDHEMLGIDEGLEMLSEEDCTSATDVRLAAQNLKDRYGIDMDVDDNKMLVVGDLTGVTAFVTEACSWWTERGEDRNAMITANVAKIFAVP